MSTKQVLVTSGISLKVLDDGKLRISTHIPDGKFEITLSHEYFHNLYIEAKEKRIEYKALEFEKTLTPYRKKEKPNYERTISFIHTDANLLPSWIQNKNRCRALASKAM